MNIKGCYELYEVEVTKMRAMVCWKGKASTLSRTDFFTAIRTCGLSNFHPCGLLSQPFGLLAQHLEREYGRF